MSAAWSFSLIVLGALLLVFSLVWALSVRKQDAGVVDILWGPAFSMVAALGLALGPGGTARRLMLLALVLVWSCRLALHLYLRGRGQGEDYRYAAMRRKQGARFVRWSLFMVFWLQALLVWLISAPIQAVALLDAPLGALDWAGVAVALAGIGVESIADRQLARFRADPASRGRVLDTGLWRYSRHPNYFGDALTWWGFGMIAASVSPLAAVAGPALMSFLLLRVSGVALLERTVVDRRPDYRRYIETTSAFIPWPPRPPRS